MVGDLAPAVLEFFAGLPRQGPGSDADTGAMLECVRDHLPPDPVVADLGCGTGGSTLLLAERLRAPVTAVERVPAFCARLRATAAARGLAPLVRVQEADMLDPPIPDGSLDLLWSEGAAYAVGFAEALRRWRRLLRPGGLCVVSECCWLAEERPEAVRRFWSEAYPAMTTLAGCAERARAAGYRVEATRVLSAAAWNGYYAAIADALDGAPGRSVGRDVRDALLTERAVFEASRGSYGYVFFVLRRSAGAAGPGM